MDSIFDPAYDFQGFDAGLSHNTGSQSANGTEFIPKFFWDSLSDMAADQKAGDSKRTQRIRGDIAVSKTDDQNGGRSHEGEEGSEEFETTAP